MPVAPAEPGEVNKARVVEGTPMNSGQQTYQAEIFVAPPGGGMNHSGRMRTMCIRGPSRISQDAAESDAKELEAAVDSGSKAVRQVANSLQRVKRSYD